VCCREQRAAEKQSTVGHVAQRRQSAEPEVVRTARPVAWLVSLPVVNVSFANWSISRFIECSTRTSGRCRARCVYTLADNVTRSTGTWSHVMDWVSQWRTMAERCTSARPKCLGLKRTKISIESRHHKSQRSHVMDLVSQWRETDEGCMSHRFHDLVQSSLTDHLNSSRHHAAMTSLRRHNAHLWFFLRHRRKTYVNVMSHRCLSCRWPAGREVDVLAYILAYCVDQDSLKTLQGQMNHYTSARHDVICDVNKSQGRLKSSDVSCLHEVGLNPDDCTNCLSIITWISLVYGWLTAESSDSISKQNQLPWNCEMHFDNLL